MKRWTLLDGSLVEDPEGPLVMYEDVLLTERALEDAENGTAVEEIAALRAQVIDMANEVRILQSDNLRLRHRFMYLLL